MNQSKFIHQEIAPAGGYPKFKFVSSNLLKKGFSSPTLFLMFGATVGTAFLLNRKRLQNQRLRQYEFAEMTSARKLVLTTLYGPAKSAPDNGGAFVWQPFAKDPRITPMVSAVMALEREKWVENYRNNSQLPEVAPYKVCYDQDETCNEYCISPDELKQYQ